MYPALCFQSLSPADFPLLLAWLAKPHVQEWWNDGDDTLEKVVEHYSADEETEPYLICCQSAENMLLPIGYIQACKEADGGMGLDLFLGEEQWLNRGVGTRALSAFIEWVQERHTVSYFSVDPSPDNKRAIRCYEKAGFRFTEIVATPTGEAAYMMRRSAERERGA